MSGKLDLSSMDGSPTVYVEGLPSDTTDDELIAYFSKVGPLKIDGNTKKGKVKLFTDGKFSRTLRGDALVTFEDPFTAPYAVTWFNEKEFRKGVVIKVAVTEPKTDDQGPQRRGGGGGQRGGRDGGGQRGGGGRNQGGRSEGPNWNCDRCGNENFPSRFKCNRCGAPKPRGDTGAAGGNAPPPSYSQGRGGQSSSYGGQPRGNPQQSTYQGQPQQPRGNPQQSTRQGQPQQYGQSSRGRDRSPDRRGGGRDGGRDRDYQNNDRSSRGGGPSGGGGNRSTYSSGPRRN